ncbi:MAG: type III secretion system export apparatus subunit SctU [Alteromonadaceae bacterium]|nr:type III secretion system export apparatus subunit SctU [Alteromonadaceae bacterium]
MSSNKTEPPTPKKIRDAREKGQVAKSKEMVSLILLVAITTCIWFDGANMLAQIKTLFEIPLRYSHLPIEQIAVPALIDVGWQTLRIISPILFVTFIFAIIANIVQVGWLFSVESIKFNIEKISLIQGTKKIFSAQNVMEFMKSIIKIVVLCIAAWYVLKNNMLLLMQLPECGAECALYVTASLIMRLIVYCLGAFVFLAGADYGLERYLHFKKLRMSVDEVRREYKDTEGNPEIKGKRKELHREMLDDEAITKRVTSADVVVTNPTHFAVCIRYDTNLAPLPFMTMKGEHLLAKKIRRIAEAHQIPIVENVPLARSLYAEIDIDRKITAQFVEPVAEIIRWLQHQQQD